MLNYRSFFGHYARAIQDDPHEAMDESASNHISISGPHGVVHVPRFHGVILNRELGRLDRTYRRIVPGSCRSMLEGWFDEFCMHDQSDWWLAIRKIGRCNLRAAAVLPSYTVHENIVIWSRHGDILRGLHFLHTADVLDQGHTFISNIDRVSVTSPFVLKQNTMPFHRSLQNINVNRVRRYAPLLIMLLSYSNMPPPKNQDEEMCHADLLRRVEQYRH